MSDIKLFSEEEIREKAHLMARNYIGGSWKNANTSNLIIREIKISPTSLIYYCSLNDDENPSDDKGPTEIVFRIFRMEHEVDYDKIATKAIIFTLLSERKIGPKLLGIFAEYRLEEYIQGDGLTYEELSNPNTSIAVAKHLAKLHSLQLPIEKRITIFKETKRYLSEKSQEESSKISELISSFNLMDELEWLTNKLESMKLSVVFSHNNLNASNIRIENNNKFCMEDRIVFLGFSRCSYNYRAYDIAEYFFQWCIDCPKNPFHVEINYKRYPNLEQQLLFIRTYLTWSCWPINERNNPSNMEDHLLNELKVLRLASHLISISRTEDYSKKYFNYLDFIKARIERYFYEKKKFLQE
ncbi:choline/ethanolamine kinase-like isoform X1 [Centruroides sculpturatus]|uniref:choline/ethanolamine kinase-like isoform X1 n=2 Tax=Centruroides sculpturatus TaxID=218467 RepID=UPI000C6D2BF7|nr:choline/ethanolamine kinase-like isoform X1 [Centruroides sculpturatus]